MVGENLQIYIVQTARKCILWVKKLKADTFAHWQNSPLGSCHSPQIEGNYSSPRQHLFFVKIPSLAERQGEKYEFVNEYLNFRFTYSKICQIMSYARIRWKSILAFTKTQSKTKYIRKILFTFVLLLSFWKINW